jgi:hypothetical protein
MIKEPPSLGRMIAMAVFALSCFGLLIFLWLSFGGPIPLKPEQYRLKVHVPEAATLANESDVRMSGITIGKVKSKALDKRGADAGQPACGLPGGRWHGAARVRRADGPARRDLLRLRQADA